MIRKFIFYIFTIFFIENAYAQTSNPFNEEIEGYGALAGLAYACQIGKELDAYDNIVRDLIYNNSLNQDEEKNYRVVYLESKKRFFLAHQRSPMASCQEIRDYFFKQPIFLFKKNPDGSMIAPDGRIIRKFKMGRG